MKLPLYFGRLIAQCAVALALFLSFNPPALAEVVRSFDTQVKVTGAAKLDIVETIVMDFQDAQKHGIYRIIPVRYTRNRNTYTTGLKVVGITDETNVPLQWVKSEQGQDINIKIGSPDVLLTGVHTYVIHYVLTRAVNFFQGAPEIYWNVTGNEWPFPLEKVTATFQIPDGVDPAAVKERCFVGVQGSTANGGIERKDHALVFQGRALKPGEGLTFVVALPGGSIKEPSVLDCFGEFLLDWWPAIFNPLLVASLIFAQWWHCGRDPGNVHIAGVEWNPPKDLSPAEVGTLIDENCDMSDIVSTLVDLAARGYLKIKELPPKGLIFTSKDYHFTRLTPPEGGVPLKLHERHFLEAVFSGSDKEVDLSDLRYDFYPNLAAIRDAIYSSLVHNGYFTQAPDSCRNFYYGMALVLSFAGVGCLAAASSVSWGLGLLLSGLIVSLSANAMPARTAKGVESCRLAIGFQRFVRKAEKERIRVLAKDDPTIFGRLLPYAMVLGAADQWAACFKDLMQQPPDWYEPYGMYDPGFRFSSTSFINDLGSGMSACSNTFGAPPPSSSSSGSGGGFSGFSDSGGFSGGGFGGGGGGSW